MYRVLASATVDELRKGLWEVTVWGGLWPVDEMPPPLCPEDYRRIYSIEARSDNLAATEAMDRFRDEIECLTDVS